MDEVVLENYVFYEHLPAFYYVRYIPSQREDWDLYATWGGISTEKEHDPWEMMIAFKGKVMEDDFLVEECAVDDK